MARTIHVSDDESTQEVDIYSEEGFAILSDLWTRSGWQHRTYRDLTWLGVPIWQLPQDLVMMQELIWRTRPDVIIETGLALGGSAVFYASVLELIGHGHLISVELSIPQPVETGLAAHPLSKRMTRVQGSSIDDGVITRVREMIGSDSRILVVLDSNHSRDHVRQELEKYSGFVGADGYIVVFDGNMERLVDAPDGRPEWMADNPAAATREFVAHHPEFEVDAHFNRLGATYCPDGFLRRRAGGPSELIQDSSRRQEEALRALVTQSQGPRLALESLLAEERRKNATAQAALQEEIAALHFKLQEVYRSRTWRVGRLIARIAGRRGRKT